MTRPASPPLPKNQGSRFDSASDFGVDTCGFMSTTFANSSWARAILVATAALCLAALNCGCRQSSSKNANANGSSSTSESDPDQSNHAANSLVTKTTNLS